MPPNAMEQHRFHEQLATPPQIATGPRADKRLQPLYKATGTAVRYGGADAAAMADESDRQRKRSGYRQLIGYRTKVWREGYSEIELVICPQHLNSIGIVHGGVYAALLDVALGHAVSYCTVPGNFRFSTTMSLNTHFLKGVRNGVLTALGRVQAVEGRVATALGEVRDDRGKLCAIAQGSFFYFPGSERAEGVPRPASGEAGKSKA
jgi:uncharacterized protein (TIGR00369 family)